MLDRAIAIKEPVACKKWQISEECVMGMKRSTNNREITIYDIAKEAGVSASTVSRVLRNNVKVSETKRERVLALVEKYNFKPNTFARGLSDTKSRTIGILAADVRNPYYASMFIACEQAARKEDYSVTLYNFLGDMELEEELLGKLQEQRVDAIILLGGHEDELVANMEYVEVINSVMASVPVVITGKLDGTQCCMVRIDNMHSMDLLMNHLLDQGHEKIAILGGRMNVLSTFEKVLRYKQILRENGIPFEAELIGQAGKYDCESGYQEMNHLFEKNLIPTAVIAINDFAAIGIIRSIHEHGLKIPGDISIVSYDNTYMAETSVPKLTSIDYNYEEYGKKLIQTAIGLIDGKSFSRLQNVAPVLIVRESSMRYTPPVN